MNNKQVLGALAMDLKRVAVGLHRGSITMASRFTEEAYKRINEVDNNQLLPYMKKVLENIRLTLSILDKDKKAEDSLMYSTIVQNYVLYK